MPFISRRKFGYRLKSSLSPYKRTLGKRRFRSLSLVPRMPSKEIKYFDLNAASAECPAANGTITTIFAPAEGTEFDERVGRMVTVKYIQVSVIFAPPTNAATVDYGGFAIIRDDGNSGTAPNFNEVFDASGANTYAMFRNIRDKGYRCQILVSKQMGPCHQTNQDNPNCIFKTIVHIPRHLSVSKFNSAASSNPVVGAYYLGLVTLNNTGAAASSGVFTVQTRVAYTDA